MITREIIHAVEPKPEELASEFCGFDEHQQAKFFNEIGRLVKAWATPFAIQLQWVGDSGLLTIDGKDAMSTIGEYSCSRPESFDEAVLNADVKRLEVRAAALATERDNLERSRASLAVDYGNMVDMVSSQDKELETLREEARQYAGVKVCLINTIGDQDKELVTLREDLNNCYQIINNLRTFATNADFVASMQKRASEGERHE